jgi:predicted transcriptional regulator
MVCCAHLCAIMQFMKRNITLKLDDDLLRKVRILAAEERTSISALLAQQLERVVREGEGYERAKRQELRALGKGMNLGFKAPRLRDELHER